MELMDNRQVFNASRYALSFSIFILAASLVYFTRYMGDVSRQIPGILDSVEKVGDKIETVMQQVSEVKEMVPSVLIEVSEIRKQIPVVVREAELIRKQAPGLLEEVSLTRQQITETTKVVDQTNRVVEQAIAESVLIRPLVPEVLNEIRATRETIPETFDRADALVEKVRETGRDASEGAVSGIFSGIIAAPFNILSDLGMKILDFGDEEFEYLTQKDMRLLKSATREVVSTGDVNTAKYWENSDNETEGKVTLAKIDRSAGMLCKILNIKIWKSKKLTTDEESVTCLNEENEWEDEDSEWE